MAGSVDRKFPVGEIPLVIGGLELIERLSCEVGGWVVNRELELVGWICRYRQRDTMWPDLG
jgi:hypothetical protein